MKMIPLFRVLALVHLLSLWPQLLCAEPLDHWHLSAGLPTPNALNCITFGNGLFIAAGDAGTILTSSDLVSWLPLWTNTLAGALHFSDAQSRVPSHRCYRAHTP